MRYIQHIISIFIVGYALFTIPLSAEANNAPDEKHIKTYHEDVTGDTHEETISLYGTPLSDDSEYYKDISAIITFPDQSEESISYEGGYQPELTFLDMNQNNTNDILFSSTMDDQENTINYQLNSIKNKEPHDIPLPKQDHVNGSFKDDFIIDLQVSPTEENESLDVENRAEKYVEAGIYDEEGKLLESASVQPQKIMQYEPVFLSSDKGYGLKSYQQINGIDKTDELGTIETLWYHEEDKWIILQSKWIDAIEEERSE